MTLKKILASAITFYMLASPSSPCANNNVSYELNGKPAITQENSKRTLTEILGDFNLAYRKGIEHLENNEYDMADYRFRRVFNYPSEKKEIKLLALYGLSEVCFDLADYLESDKEDINKSLMNKIALNKKEDARIIYRDMISLAEEFKEEGMDERIAEGYVSFAFTMLFYIDIVNNYNPEKKKSFLRICNQESIKWRNIPDFMKERFKKRIKWIIKNEN